MQPLAWAISRSYTGALGECRLGMCTSARSLWGSIYILVDSLDFVAATRGHLYISWVWWPKKLTFAGPTEQ